MPVLVLLVAFFAKSFAEFSALIVSSKNSPAVYRMTRFECYNHSVGATNPNCNFSLELLERGRFVHFIGVRPDVRINRTPNGIQSIEIFNDIAILGHRLGPVELVN